MFYLFLLFSTLFALRIIALAFRVARKGEHSIKEVPVFNIGYGHSFDETYIAMCVLWKVLHFLQQSCFQSCFHLTYRRSFFDSLIIASKQVVDTLRGPTQRKKGGEDCEVFLLSSLDHTPTYIRVFKLIVHFLQSREMQNHPQGRACCLARLI